MENFIFAARFHTNSLHSKQCEEQHSATEAAVKMKFFMNRSACSTILVFRAEESNIKTNALYCFVFVVSYNEE